jgi:hypothetical protein
LQPAFKRSATNPSFARAGAPAKEPWDIGRSEKVLVNRKPKTWFQITPDGRRALERLFRQLEELLTRAG